MKNKIVDGLLAEKGCKESLEKAGWRILPSGVLTSMHNMDNDCTLFFRRFDLDQFKQENNYNNHFEDYESLQQIKSEQDSIVIGFDAEYYLDQKDVTRKVISYQFALIWKGYLCQFVFLMNVEGGKLWLEYVLGRILNYLGVKPTDCRSITKYVAVTGFDDKKKEPIEEKFDTSKEAEEASIENDKDKKKKVKTIYDWSGIGRINVTLVAHSGIAAITCLDQQKKFRHTIVNHLTDVSGGVVSLRDFFIPATDCNHGSHQYQYPITLNIRDTMCYAPEKSKALKILAQAINIPKIELKQWEKKDMKAYLLLETENYMEYVSNDVLIILLYTSALFGENKLPPVTLTSVTANVVKENIMNYLSCNNTKDFDLTYRGLVKVRRRNEDNEDKQLKGRTFGSSFLPCTDAAKVVINMGIDSYHGGYNSASKIGYYSCITIDKDLKNAYPVGMCLVPDINWNDPINKTLDNHLLTLDDFKEDGKINPLLPLLAFVKFKFPKNCKFPCIPMQVEDSLLFFLTSEGEDGVYACGPELYLACKLGAEIKVKRGYILNTLKIEGKVSYSLRAAVHQLVFDRLKAKKELGKGSLEEMILKIMVNAIYGKESQNVKEKRAWNNYLMRMQDLNASAITNPISAAITTSIIRAVLIAAQNQITDQGYQCYSVTTDGFIVDCPDEILAALDLYGFKPYLESIRLFLSEGKDKEIWDTKHVQDDLLNLNTRLNTSLHDGICNPYRDEEGNNWPGVNAHGGIHTPYESDSYLDREWFIKVLVTRNGKIESVNTTRTNSKDICLGQEYAEYKQVKNISADYDMKRKPIEESLKAIEIKIEEKKYEIANYDTEPFGTKEEYLKYRKARSEKECIKTVEQIRHFLMRTKFKENSGKIRAKDGDEPKKIMMDCIRGYFQGKWSIPIYEGFKGEKLLKKINETCEGFSITKTDLANARRKDRKCTVPEEMLLEKVKELGGEEN